MRNFSTDSFISLLSLVISIIGIYYAKKQIQRKRVVCSKPIINGLTETERSNFTAINKNIKAHELKSCEFSIINVGNTQIEVKDFNSDPIIIKMVNCDYVFDAEIIHKNPSDLKVKAKVFSSKKYIHISPLMLNSTYSFRVKTIFVGKNPEILISSNISGLKRIEFEGEGKKKYAKGIIVSVIFIALFSLISAYYFYKEVTKESVFNNHPDDCPTVGVTKTNLATASCWPTRIDGVDAGDEVCFGVYFHNNSPIDTGIKVKLSNPGSNYWNSVVINGLILPEGGVGARGFAEIIFKRKLRLKYKFTKVYFNGQDDGTGGTIVDITGRVFNEGETIEIVPGLCENCNDLFLWQGVVKVYFDVIE